MSRDSAVARRHASRAPARRRCARAADRSSARCSHAACGGSPPAEHPAPAAPPAAEPSAGCRTGNEPRGGRRATASSTAGRSSSTRRPRRAIVPLPLVLAFHGFRSSPEDLRDGTGLAELARTDGVVVVYPAGPRRRASSWGPSGVGWDLRPDQTTDRDFVRDLLDQLEREPLRRSAAHLRHRHVERRLPGEPARLPARRPPRGRRAGRRRARPRRPARRRGPFRSSSCTEPPTPWSRPDLIRGGVAWWARQNACGASAPGEGCTRWSGCAADVVACEGPQAHRWPRGRDRSGSGSSSRRTSGRDRLPGSS